MSKKKRNKIIIHWFRDQQCNAIVPIDQVADFTEAMFGLPKN